MAHRDPDENGWQSSASAWIARTGDQGDFARAFVLDKIMLERAVAHQPKNVLDVGCGEGRFCRMLASQDIATCGIDPVQDMINEAKRLHPAGDYRLGFAEGLALPDASFDLIISYLALIDINDADAAIREMARVLKPGGRILIANLNSFVTAGASLGSKTCKETGDAFHPLGIYHQVRQDWFEWDGVRVQNWHRPLSHYMKWFLEAGLNLTHFDEPEPHGGPTDRVKAYQHMPYLMVMEWQKPLL